MISANNILVIVGIFTIVIGIAAFLNPGFARLINAPGGPRIKAVVALIIGIIIFIVGLVVQLPA